MSDWGARALVFFSSASILVLEILAGRLMAPYVGVSLETFTAIIGVILAGIAAGNAIGGRLADRIDPRHTIGPALMAGGALAWVSLWIVGAVGPHVEASPASTVMLATVSFVLPAMVLSTISPMVAKLAVQSLTETGRVVGDLSAWSTAGALFGTFITGFVLVAAIATRPIVLAVGAGLVVVGLVLSVRQRQRVPDAAMIVALAIAGLAGVTADRPCEFESAYSCGRVTTDPDDASVRYLVLDDVRHGAVDLDDPTNQPFRYIRLISSVIDQTSTGAIDALHLGGGAFSTPMWVDATRPGSTNHVLEIDDELVKVAEREFGFVRDDTMTVANGDARISIRDVADDSTDVVVGDAFTGASVPWHLTTTEFISEIDRVLRDDGIYVMNVIDGGANRFVEWELATLLDNFNYVAVIAPPSGISSRPQNQILVASDQPLPELLIDSDDGVLVDDVTAFVDGGRVLTDDYAPVDQLTQSFSHR